MSSNNGEFIDVNVLVDNGEVQEYSCVVASKQPDVTPENVLDLDIPAIALDERFGSLKFDKASENLSNIQSYLIEAQDLNYRDLLLDEQINQIDQFKKPVELLSKRIQEKLDAQKKFEPQKTLAKKGRKGQAGPQTNTLLRTVEAIRTWIGIQDELIYVPVLQ